MIHMLRVLIAASLLVGCSANDSASEPENGKTAPAQESRSPGVESQAARTQLRSNAALAKAVGFGQVETETAAKPAYAESTRDVGGRSAAAVSEETAELYGHAPGENVQSARGQNAQSASAGVEQ